MPEDETSSEAQANDNAQKIGDKKAETDFGIPKLAEFPNFHSRTLFYTLNPFKRGYRFFKRVRRMLAVPSDVFYHQEDVRVVRTIIFIVIFLAILVGLTILIFKP